jgi:hypothetical protein
MYDELPGHSLGELRKLSVRAAFIGQRSFRQAEPGGQAMSENFDSEN